MERIGDALMTTMTIFPRVSLEKVKGFGDCSMTARREMTDGGLEMVLEMLTMKNEHLGSCLSHDLRKRVQTHSSLNVHSPACTEQS